MQQWTTHLPTDPRALKTTVPANPSRSTLIRWAYASNEACCCCCCPRPATLHAHAMSHAVPAPPLPSSSLHCPCLLPNVFTTRSHILAHGSSLPSPRAPSRSRPRPQSRAFNPAQQQGIHGHAPSPAFRKSMLLLAYMSMLTLSPLPMYVITLTPSL